MMNSREIRQSFLDFFKGKEHRIVPSAPVAPQGDPTLLFTNAGMNQFKDVFLGVGTRDYHRAADTQKCIRVSGKHNDLEEVGVDTYHHTFFEMLGNWSFGDYYKHEAIDWAWELLVGIWKLDPKRLHATVYRTDDEAYELWQKYLPLERIHRFDEKDNFWEMGETGPCGPCSEVHYDRTPDFSGGPLVNAGVPEVIEIWNLVFIQYNRKIDGSLEELSSKHVDTGMGFERICAVIQGKTSNYDSDVFKPLLDKIEKLSGKTYNPELTDPTGIAMRVIADHARTLSFAIADGALPGNEGRSYVLRRILRRASRYARNLGFREPIIYKLVDTIRDTMGDVFPELVSQYDIIVKVIKGEEESFLQTLDKGLEIFDHIVEKMKKENISTVPGEDAFQLYDTFGFPIDLTELIAREKGYGIDKDGFDRLMKEQKDRSRAARKVTHQEVETPIFDGKTEFVGYFNSECEAKVLFVQGAQVILDKTTLYVESGGQTSDTGSIFVGAKEYKVLDLKKSGAAIVHICEENIDVKIGETVKVCFDLARRRSISRNHSATHLLHEALRTVLGSHVKQSGSSVGPDSLRFDFNHFEKVSAEDLKKAEDLANQKVLEAIEVQIDELTIEQARENSKIKMFFGDKYGDIVRVVTMDENYSIELCGGAHVRNTAEIGFIKILSESSVAAGVRRIEAVTGKGAIEYVESLNTKIDDLNKNCDELNAKIHNLEKEIAKMKQADLAKGFSDMIGGAYQFGDIRIVAQEISAENLDALRNLGEEIRNELGTNGIAILGAKIEDKAQLCCVVTDDLKAKYPAGKLVGAAAKQLGGGGGGKPHLATAGGKDVDKLSALIADFHTIVEQF
jgi:alanyl-tRNA synthetase